MGAYGDTGVPKGAVEQVTGSPAGGNCWCGRIEDVERITGIRYQGG
jgi:hypothetical protein